MTTQGATRRFTMVWPGTGRITLALLVAVPAAMAYPWRSPREQWVLGVAAAVVVVLFSWWRGRHVTAIVGRRLAMIRPHRPRGGMGHGATAEATTVLLNIGPLTDVGTLPLPLIARYLDRYGIRAQGIRVTSRDNPLSASGVRETWIGLTVSAVENLAALRARSPRIPLHETAQVAARRLADHLHEIGWAAGTVRSDDVAQLVAPGARETWRGVVEEGGDYVAAYRISVNDELSDTLAAIWSYPALETWTALEIAGDGTGRTMAAACAFRTSGQPAGAAPLAGLTPQLGSHRRALTTLDPLSTQRLDGHVHPPADLLARLSWPTAVDPPAMPVDAVRSAS